MTRAISQSAPIWLLMMLTAACGSPSAPSPASTTAASAPESAVLPPQPGTPAAAAGSGGFEFLGSDPGPGAETSVRGIGGGLILTDLTVRLAVHSSQSLPDAKVEFELFDASGRQCAFGFVDRPVGPGHVYPVSNAFWVWETDDCGNFPVSTTTLKATLLTLRDTGSGGLLQRTEYATTTFPVGYTIRRYPPPPGGPETAPSISDLSWSAGIPTGGDAPLPGDPFTVQCTGREADGAPVTVTIAVTWPGRAPQHFSHPFPAGASSSPTGAVYRIGVVTPNVPDTRARFDCLVRNDRGQQATQVFQIK